MEEMEKTAAGRKIGEERLREWTRTLLEYQAGKHSVDTRIINAESWWKLRNCAEEDKEALSERTGFRSRSGWIHIFFDN